MFRYTFILLFVLLVQTVGLSEAPCCQRPMPFLTDPPDSSWISTDALPEPSIFQALEQPDIFPSPICQDEAELFKPADSDELLLPFDGSDRPGLSMSVQIILLGGLGLGLLTLRVWVEKRQNRVDD